MRAEVDVPIALDETAAEEGAAAFGAADAVCLKIARCGGSRQSCVTPVEGEARSAAAYSLDLRRPLGIAAASTSRPAVRGRAAPHGLATLRLRDPGERLHAVRGAIRVPRSPAWVLTSAEEVPREHHQWFLEMTCPSSCRRARVGSMWG